MPCRRKKEMEHVKLELSVTKDGKKRKSKLEVYNLYLPQRLKGVCRTEGLGMDGSIAYLGFDKRDSLRTLGSKEVMRCAAWKRRVGTVKKLEVFQRQYPCKGTTKS